MSENNTTRLNKFISESGLCSRREADRFIEQGLVLVNGEKAVLGTKVMLGDTVTVNGKMVNAKNKEESVYIAFNKPKGIVCTTDVSIPQNIISYLNYPQRIFPIGRLDKDSQGLILLTSNGDIVNKILRAGNNHEKEYVVTVNKEITNDFIQKMSNGIPILNTVTKKCTVQKESTFVFKIILVQGLNRQIRRMCEYLNYKVIKLERIRIMTLSIEGINVGKYRELSTNEMLQINELIKNSTGTEEAST